MYAFLLPEDFLIGTAHSSFQSEGAWDRDGKSVSMMDHFSVAYGGKPIPGTVNNKTVRYVSDQTPEQGCHFYDNYEAYIEDMAKTGQNVFRMSLSWPRILPTGYGAVNSKAIAYYNKVIDKLLEKGITPFVDLCHWDVPQCLYEEDGAYRSDRFPEWFEAYARVCFEAFGDRVKLWSTFNEPGVALVGYVNGCFPPYEQAHAGGMRAILNTALAHFRAVRAFRQLCRDGQIGAVMASVPITPAGMNRADIEAAERMSLYRFDLYLQPFAEGKFPETLLEQCPFLKAAMPEGYQQKLNRWFVPMDFVGLNYYQSERTAYDPSRPLLARGVQNFYAAPGQKFAAYPQGLMDVAWYVWERYQLPMYISENGMSREDKGDEELDCDDADRIVYIREHLRMVVRCIRLGLPVRGYFYWDDADCFEQQSGYAYRFGLTWVDRQTGRRRWKKSRHYYAQICHSRMVD